MRTLREIYMTLFLICLAGIAMAQDVIVKTDQTTVLSKVLEISSTEIKYKKWGNLDGPTYSISRSEVVSINYENGEVETLSDKPTSQMYNKQNTQSHHRGFMEPNSNRITLKLDGRELSNEEVRNLVGNQYYQLYIQGHNLGIAADVMLCLSCLTGGGAVAAIRAAINGKEQFQTLAITLSLLTVGEFIGTLVMGASGSSKLNQVAKAYNNGQAGRFSFNISPSMMRYETFPSQGICGLGLTVSMNF